MRAHDRAKGTGDDPRVWQRLLQGFGEGAGALSRVKVLDGDLDCATQGGRQGKLGQAREGLRRRTHALQGHDLAVEDLQDRLDLEGLPDSGARRPDAPTAAKVLERVDVEE